MFLSKLYQLLNRDKIRKTLSDPSTIEQHVQNNSIGKPKTKAKLLNKRNKKNNMIGAKQNNFELTKKSLQSKGTFNKSR